MLHLAYTWPNVEIPGNLRLAARGLGAGGGCNMFLRSGVGAPATSYRILYYGLIYGDIAYGLES